MGSESAEPGGRTALVTGASSGIGEATAVTLAENGYRVVCAARSEDRLAELCERIGGAARPLVLDVTDASSVEGLLSRLPEDWRAIDILVNNAGHDEGGRRRFDEGSAQTWAHIIETNVIGLIRATRAVIPGMIARDRGHVVNIGSIAGISPYATGTIYSASKHAVHGFSEALRLDFAGTGIRVTEILPGMVRTSFALNRWHDEARAERFYDDFGECLVPEDIARSVLFAVQQPANVVVSQLVVVPSAQS
ncbi:MAG: SDR family NAD(P)-dependent oxidoreductase [Gammaproteobacteria bacterium]|nr:SDR family NAD(P)-dependent oxidoreductase [Gammaproteobacteria bacterium]NIM72798.1 SDR family NAD(P)-dependent oxidoreductase [Gammaproteobacteria bacterium]NIN38255.1 SDR family NAD(P)-dependent oxidoreductase [Gammaproteobacteria bacterium]NIO24546.1 SDR family NAD(P)-dependent oxidoreductase [Gammaproteobacteria bacterium]NIO65155.1 SDR family NAD(P)-dependent oxidoreductase [Gammaproteobacteria bacterium]